MILSTNVSIKFKSAANCYQKFGTNIPSFIVETITAKSLGMLLFFFFVCLFFKYRVTFLEEGKNSPCVLPVKMFFCSVKDSKDVM